MSNIFWHVAKSIREATIGKASLNHGQSQSRLELKDLSYM